MASLFEGQGFLGALGSGILFLLGILVALVILVLIVAIVFSMWSSLHKAKAKHDADMDWLQSVIDRENKNRRGGP